MKSLFGKKKTAFEKVFVILILGFIIASVVASNINLNILVYAGFGSYVVLGLVAFFRPNSVFEILKREDEDYLVRNQRKIPLIKAGIRYGGFVIAVFGVVLNYIFVSFY